MTRKISKIPVLILFLLFVFYYAGSNFFSHIHTVDGVKVVHSHPYSGDGKQHHHSRGAIEILSHTFYTFVATLVAPVLIVIFSGTFYSVYRKVRTEYICLCKNSRAPPVLNYF